MPLGRNAVTLILFMVIISIIEQIVDQQHIRAIWDWNQHNIVSVYNYISYDDDLRLLARMTINTFDTIMNRMLVYFKWPRYWYLTDEIDANGNYTGRIVNKAISPHDQFLRYCMINAGYKVTQLEHTFGQQKSVIYLDYKFVSYQLVHVLGDEWLSLPDPQSHEYANLLGAGVFTEAGEVIFGNVPYIVDVTSIRIQRPKYGQRAYYNGHKKYHTVDFHCVHSGTGRIYNVSGPIPGSHNDIQSAKTCLLYTQRHAYLAPEHAALSDLAYYYIGDPFLCRVAFQSSYTTTENIYNMYHSKVRVISENWYCRFKNVWSYWCKPWAMSLDDIGISFRAMAIITNIIITIQDPLRR